MGYLESEEINSSDVHLCHHRESTAQPVSHPFHPLFVGRLRSIGRNHSQGHFHQHGFVTSDFTSSASKFSTAAIPVDPSLPLQYSRCGTIVSSVGKLWVLPYLLIISYQLRASHGAFSTLLGAHLTRKVTLTFTLIKISRLHHSIPLHARSSLLSTLQVDGIVFLARSRHPRLTDSPPPPELGILYFVSMLGS